MLRIKRHSHKRIITSALVMILVAVMTVSIALLGYHLASRYRETITDAINGITTKISGFEKDIFPSGDISESDTKK